jgi:hypothetical protein
MSSDYVLLGPTAKVAIQSYVRNPTTGILINQGSPIRYGVVRGRYRQTFDNPETTDSEDGPSGSTGLVGTPGIFPQSAAKNFKTGLYMIEATITAQRQTNLPPHLLTGLNIGNGDFIGLAISPDGSFNVKRTYFISMFTVENFEVSLQVSASEPQGFEFSGKGAVSARSIGPGASALSFPIGTAVPLPQGL